MQYRRLIENEIVVTVIGRLRTHGLLAGVCTETNLVPVG